MLEADSQGEGRVSVPNMSVPMRVVFTCVTFVLAVGCLVVTLRSQTIFDQVFNAALTVLVTAIFAMFLAELDHPST